MTDAILFYAGFILLVLPFTEEFSRGLGWVRAALRRHPPLRFIAYPLAALLLLIAGVLIAKAFLKLCDLRFSYE